MEKFPVDENIEVLDAEVIFHTKKWWMAALKIRAFGRVKYKIYLWLMQDGQWRAKQKMTIADAATWENVKKAVDALLSRH